MVKRVNGNIYSDLITSSREELFGFYDDNTPKKFIVIHGMATVNFNGGMSGWYSNINPTGRQASANYCVSDIEIVGCVGENYGAWHCGGVGSITNQNSIGIEHVNSSIGNYADASTYLFSEDTLINGAKLCAEICLRLGIPIDREHIVPHRDVYATACPQTLDIDDYIARVKKFAKGEVPNALPEQKEEIDMNGLLVVTKSDFGGAFAINRIFYWSISTGFIYMPDMACIDILNKQSQHSTGKNLLVYDSSLSSPWHLRMAQMNNKVKI